MRLCSQRLHNLQIGAQFLDSENVQRNVEFEQIPRLHGTYPDVVIAVCLIQYSILILCFLDCIQLLTTKC